MILFGLSPNIIPQEFMDQHDIKNVLVYNLTTMSSAFPTLGALVPDPGYVNTQDEFQFDMLYANYLMSNDMAFISLMTLMYPLYWEGSTLVLVLIEHSPFRDTVMESLIKFIQQRYGYNCGIVHTPEDFMYIGHSAFSSAGVRAMDQDSIRYAMLLGGVEVGSNDE